MNSEDRERLVRVETKIDMIMDSLKSKASKSALGYITWAVGGIASLAFTALIMAFTK